VLTFRPSQVLKSALNNGYVPPAPGSASSDHDAGDDDSEP